MAVVQPHTYVIDNEASNTLNKAFKKIHRQLTTGITTLSLGKKSERDIQTFKDRFKAVVATVYPEFPIANWYILLTKSVMTLNML